LKGRDLNPLFNTNTCVGGYHSKGKKAGPDPRVYSNERSKGEAMYKKAVLMMALGVVMAAVPVYGGDLPDDVKAGFEKAGMKIYPGAVYCTGQLEWGIRFATSDSPEKVMQW
jgi:hypothetical protein